MECHPCSCPMFGETVTIFVKYAVVQGQVISVALRGNDVLLYKNSCYRCCLSIGEEGKDDVQMNSHIPGAER